MFFLFINLFNQLVIQSIFITCLNDENVRIVGNFEFDTDESAKAYTNTFRDSADRSLLQKQLFVFVLRNRDRKEINSVSRALFCRKSHNCFS